MKILTDRLLEIAEGAMGSSKPPILTADEQQRICTDLLEALLLLRQTQARCTYTNKEMRRLDALLWRYPSNDM